MIPTYVVIPFRNELHLTLNIIRQLRQYGGWDEIFLFDNESDQNISDAVKSHIVYDSNIIYYKSAGNNIYRMWNHGWAFAENKANGNDFNVCFLNNDITITEGTLQGMKEVLRTREDCGIVYPNYDLPTNEGWDGNLAAVETHGTYKDGGMGGWCFMIKGESLHRGVKFVDENLKWWCGDDFLAREFEMNGYRQMRVLNLPVDHINEATCNNAENIGWTSAQKSLDWDYYHSL